MVGLSANNGGDAGLYRQYRGKLPVGHRKRLLSKLYNKWWAVRVLIQLHQSFNTALAGSKYTFTGLLTLLK